MFLYGHFRWRAWCNCGTVRESGPCRGRNQSHHVAAVDNGQWRACGGWRRRGPRGPWLAPARRHWSPKRTGWLEIGCEKLWQLSASEADLGFQPSMFDSNQPKFGLESLIWINCFSCCFRVSVFSLHLCFEIWDREKNYGVLGSTGVIMWRGNQKPFGPLTGLFGCFYPIFLCFMNKYTVHPFMLNWFLISQNLSFLTRSISKRKFIQLAN